jgi:putative ABC transport system permease protein
MGSMLRQCATVIGLNVSSIPQRLLMSLATILSVAVAVGVLLGFLALAAGFRQTLSGSGSQDVAVVLRGGASSEINSVVGRDQVRLLEVLPGVAKDAEGKPIISSELYIVVDGKRRSTGVKANMPMRGIALSGVALRAPARIAEGRMFSPGSNEIVVGRGLIREFAGFDLGNEVRFGTGTWKIVGVFEAPGTVFESELWADAAVVQSLFNRGTSFQTVRVKLTGPDQLEAFKAAVAADPQLNLEVKSEKAFYADQAGGTAQLVEMVGMPLGILMAIGALAGALNTMFASVSNRAAEISTLRIIGFSGFAAFVGTMVEALALALIGAAVGIVACYLMFNGLTTSTLGQGFTQVVFQLKVTPEVIQQGVIIALAVGIIGGLFPAIRAARMKPLLGVTQ